MDNLTHSLVGWALGEAGLKRKTGFGVAALVIAANLPDIDVLGFPFGENLAFRRGITHGPLALVLMAPGLTAALVAFDRWQARRGTRPLARPPVRPAWLFALVVIGLLTHPALDFLNVYGIRLLMPFSDRWVYGDTLFIIDVWVWIVLAAGIALSRRRSAAIPARASLAAMLVYIGAMAIGTGMANTALLRAVDERGYGSVKTLATSPPPINPFQRDIVYNLGDSYGFGTVVLSPRPVVALSPPSPKHMDDPAIAVAAQSSKPLADFLYWSRMPFATVTRSGAGTTIVVGDARFARTPVGNRFSVAVELPQP